MSLSRQLCEFIVDFSYPLIFHCCYVDPMIELIWILMCLCMYMCICMSMCLCMFMYPCMCTSLCLRTVMCICKHLIFVLASSRVVLVLSLWSSARATHEIWCAACRRKCELLLLLLNIDNGVGTKTTQLVHATIYQVHILLTFFNIILYFDNTHFEHMMHRPIIDWPFMCFRTVLPWHLGGWYDSGRCPNMAVIRFTACWKSSWPP